MTDSIQKEIKEALEKRKSMGIWELNSQDNTWLLHQQELIEQKDKSLHEQFEINTKLVVRLEQKDTEIERIEEKWKKLLRVRMDADNTNIWKLQEENKRLREALEWYADKKNWQLRVRITKIGRAHV